MIMSIIFIALFLWGVILILRALVGAGVITFRIFQWNKRRLDHFKKMEEERKYYALPKILGGDGN